MLFNEYSNPYVNGKNVFQSKANLKAPFIVTMCMDEFSILVSGDPDFYTCTVNFSFL